MATDRPLDLDRLTLDAVRDGALREQPVTVLGFARSGIALARFFSDAGATVTVYDGRPEADLADSLAQLEGRRPPARGFRCGPACRLGRRRPRGDLAVDQSRLPDDRAKAARSPAGARGRPTVGRPGAPALVSEADLFLRLCPAPTIGVTGTKGKTTTASLIAAVLAGDTRHPVVLGGNIGIPLVERLPELTPDHRVVIELSELQLPTLSRGTTVAVYTNVTSDHLDRHGTLEGYRAAKRRLAELVDPDGALVLNADDPVVAAYADLGTAPATLYRQARPMPGQVGVDDGWIVAAGVRRLLHAGGGTAATGPDGRILPVGDLAIPGRTTSRTPSPRSPRASCSGSPRRRSAVLRPPSRGSSIGSSRSP